MGQGVETVTLSQAIAIYRHPYLFPGDQAEALDVILAARKGLME